MKAINTVIIEDEERAISALKKLLLKTSLNINITGVARNVKESINCIDKLKPELVLLDIELPDGDGFDILEQVSYKGFEFIVITGHDEYAVRAFQFTAIHYLLKPINYLELHDAITRFQKFRSEKIFDQKVEILKQSLNDNCLQKIIVPSSDGLKIIELSQIIRCEAFKNYTIIYQANGNSMVASKSLNHYEDLLKELDFERPHIKHLINLAYIKEFKNTKRGFVILKDGTYIEVSDRKKKYFVQQLKNYVQAC